MNKVILMGRLTRDPELRTTSSNTSVCSFTLAVDRRFKNANGERQADFISCTAWRQTAEFLCRYFRQGSRLALVGSIQTSSWEDSDGKRQYRTDVVADEIYFAEGRRSEGASDEHAANRSYASGGGNRRQAPASGGRTYGASSSRPSDSYERSDRSPRTEEPSFEDSFAPGPDDDSVLPFNI